jgi:hypothetical protein
VIIDGETYTTDPLPFQVQSAASGATAGDGSIPDIFIEMVFDDDTPVLGQQLLAEVVLYFRSGLEVQSFQPLTGWSADGLWKEELEGQAQPRAEDALIQGQRFRKATLLKFLVFPTRTGTLVVDPFPMVLGVRSQVSSRDPFGSIFDSFGTNLRRVTLQTDEVELNVTRPTNPPNVDVILDAVGSFTITRVPLLVKCSWGGNRDNTRFSTGIFSFTRQMGLPEMQNTPPKNVEFWLDERVKQRVTICRL